MANIAVIWYSATGNVHAPAEAVPAGAEQAGATVRLRPEAELAPAEAIDSDPAWRAHADATTDVPVASDEDLRGGDALTAMRSSTGSPRKRADSSAMVSPRQATRRRPTGCGAARRRAGPIAGSAARLKEAALAG